jgi:hypothetical protein
MAGTISMIAFRLVAISAYALSLFIFYWVHPIAEKAYNDLCRVHGMTFAERPSLQFLSAVMLVIAIPALLARSKILTIVNAIVGIQILFVACMLFSTVSNTPYQCFTSFGTYEDHTSGLNDFEMWFFFATVFSYVLLFADLGIWSMKRVLAFRATYQTK